MYIFLTLFPLFFIMKRLELSMGRMIPNGGTVNDFLMDEFIRENILPEMEYGTLIDGEGFWKGEHEPVKILYVDVTEDELISMRKVFTKIANLYKKAFNQDAVLMSEVVTNDALI